MGRQTQIKWRVQVTGMGFPQVEIPVPVPVPAPKPAPKPAGIPVPVIFTPKWSYIAGLREVFRQLRQGQ